MQPQLSTPEWNEFERKLARLADQVDAKGEWPTEQLMAAGEAGVYRWFAPESLEGWNWSDEDQAIGYLQISRVCLTTAFIITQRTAAFTRLLASENNVAKERWLSELVSGKSFATVGIRHLTTSRQHLGIPVLKARPIDRDQFILEGYAPWVTGCAYADCIVVGAALMDGQQILACVDTKLPGIATGPGLSLLGLSASKTDRVDFNEVRIRREDILFGPVDGVMQRSKSSGAGGLQTSTLALGLARCALDYLRTEASSRSELIATTDKKEQAWQALWKDLLSHARGTPSCSNEKLRHRANSLVLRATQSTIIASKGAGYLVENPVARWCCEAMFFLVWSCPMNVSHASLCELAGMASNQENNC
jgi:alkylation response protein AidB-like acyl-CoA dehydrogenase